MYRDKCVFKKRKGECYHQIKQEIRRYEMPRWPNRTINHVHYLREIELCKGRIVNIKIAQIHITGTCFGFFSVYRNVHRHDYYKLAGQTSRYGPYGSKDVPILIVRDK